MVKIDPVKYDKLLISISKEPAVDINCNCGCKFGYLIDGFVYCISCWELILKYEIKLLSENRGVLSGK